MNRIISKTEEQKKELASTYNMVIEQLGLNEYKKSKEISKELKITDRMWRKHTENIMNLYRLGYMDKVVIGTIKGYIATNDKNIIDNFLKAKNNQFKSMASNYYKLKKALIEKENYSIDDFVEELKKECIS